MNKFILLSALAGTILLGATVFLIHKKASSNEIVITEEIYAQWTQFKRIYGKKYSEPEFETHRLQVFARNLEVVKADKTGTYGVTQFFD